MHLSSLPVWTNDDRRSCQTQHALLAWALFLAPPDVSETSQRAQSECFTEDIRGTVPKLWCITQHSSKYRDVSYEVSSAGWRVTAMFGGMLVSSEAPVLSMQSQPPFRPSLREKKCDISADAPNLICEWHANPLFQPASNHRLNRALSKGHKQLPEMGDFLLAVLNMSLEFVLASCTCSHQSGTCMCKICTAIVMSSAQINERDVSRGMFACQLTVRLYMLLQ